MEWGYSPEWDEKTLTDGNYCSFVYVIYFPDLCQYYIGVKQMYKRVKDSKKIKPTSISNGWEEYTSSSKTVNRLIDEGYSYLKVILWGFPTTGDAVLVETMLIVLNCCLPGNINGAILAKVKLPNMEKRKAIHGIVQEIQQWLN